MHSRHLREPKTEGAAVQNSTLALPRRAEPTPADADVVVDLGIARAARQAARTAPQTVPRPTVAIMLCTMNGERFIEEQLRSIAGQTCTDFVVYASDDGSTDRTVELLEQARDGCLKDRLRFLQGPGTGFQNNFLSIFSLDAAPADFVAFCDQDDVWKPEKLERAVARLARVAPDCPAIYGGRTILIDADGREIGLSANFSRKPAFANALLQSLFGGNTLVMNEAAWRLAKRMLVAPVVSHDWWMYQIVTGVGGRVLYDEHPTVCYRQHGGNLVGERRSPRALFARLRALMGGRYRRWNETNTRALLPVSDQLTQESRTALEAFCRAREARVFARLHLFWKSHLHRQSMAEGLVLWFAVVLKKI